MKGRLFVMTFLAMLFLDIQVCRAVFSIDEGSEYIDAYWGAQNYNTITVTNADLEVTFTKDPYFSMHSIVYKGKELMYSGTDRIHGYWSVITKDSSQNSVYCTFCDTDSQWIRRDTADVKEIRWEVSPGYQDSQNNTITLQRLRIYFIFEKDNPGFYVYMTARDLDDGYLMSEKDDCRIAQFEWKTRLNENLFDYNFNSSGDYYYLPVADFPQNINYGGADDRFLMDATFKLSDGTVYSKYDFCFDSSKDEHLLNGFVSRRVDGYRYGAWLLQLSDEWMNGAPYKNELCCHMDEYSACLLFEGRTDHYGQHQEPLVPEAGWCKVYGPVYYGFNRSSSTDVRDLYYDARDNILPNQQAKWPFESTDILDNTNYCFRDDRRVVSGDISIAGLPQGVVAGWKKVILSKPIGSSIGNKYDNKSWYLNSESYAYSARTLGSSYSIADVSEGTYGVYIIAENVLAEGYMGNITVGSSNVVKDINWNINRANRTHLLTVGTADHSSAEFCGGDYRHFGEWFQGYPYDFGGVNVNWYSDTSLNEDWPYTQWIWVAGQYTQPFLHRTVNNEWNDTFLNSLQNKPESRIYFKHNESWASNDTVYVRVATTASSYAKLLVRVYANGSVSSQTWTLTGDKDSSGYRSGGFGIYRTAELEFSGDKFDQTYPYETLIVFKMYQNLYPDLVNKTYTSDAGANHQSSITYDCIQVEVEKSN